MLESPFTFPDEDHYPIYLTETPGGGVKLSDRGHTLMHVSYEHDVDFFHEGATASLRAQIVRESGIDEEEGVFSMDAPSDQVATALFRFGQAFPSSCSRTNGGFHGSISPGSPTLPERRSPASMRHKTFAERLNDSRREPNRSGFQDA